MDGTNELLQLAHMLRTGAEVSRQIAGIRPHDAEAIGRLADQALTIAETIERIAHRSGAGTGDMHS